MEGSELYRTGSKGEALRAVFLPDFPLIWAMLLEDIAQYSPKGLDYLRELNRGEDDVESILLDAFLFEHSIHEEMWHSLTDGDEIALEYNSTLKRWWETYLYEQMRPSTTITAPASMSEAPAMNVQEKPTRKIYLPKK